MWSQSVPVTFHRYECFTSDLVGNGTTPTIPRWYMMSSNALKDKARQVQDDTISCIACIYCWFTCCCPCGWYLDKYIDKGQSLPALRSIACLSTPSDLRQRSLFTALSTSSILMLQTMERRSKFASSARVLSIELLGIP